MPLIAAIDPWILAFSSITVLVTIWMGFRSAKTSKSASDFFVAGRSVGVGMNASAISGEYLSAASFMGVAGMVMSSGYDALWYPVCYACGYLFLLLFIAGPLRRFGAYTIPDFAEGRYDSPLFRKIAVIFVLFIGFFYTMPQMKGAGTTLAYIFPGLPYWVGVVLVGAVITLNVALGGMKGITLVQAFQYWAKMFAISVPVFVLMAVYGGYGGQLSFNKTVLPHPETVPGYSVIEGTPRVAMPVQAPKDSVWLNPFGPLTTKAAKAANAVPRWNLSSETRATLRDFQGRPASGILEVLEDRAESMVNRLRTQRAVPARISQFADWTNMPPNTGRTLPDGFPLLATLHEFGLLAERPVLVATNLPGGRIDIGGSFHSRDELLKQWEARLLTNGVRLDMSNNVIKAVAVADWDRYANNPGSVPLVPCRLFGVQTNADSRFLADRYGDVVGRDVLLATNLPPFVSASPEQAPQALLAPDAAALIQKTLAGRGVTLIPAGDREVWAVPTVELAKFQFKPVNEKRLALLYTYSLIIALVCGTAGLPHILVRFYTNPDGVAAKKTTMWVMILIGVFYVFPPVFGVMGRNLFPELYNGVGSKGTDKIVLELPRLLNEKYGVLGSVLSGITCAGAFAAFMSTFSGLLVSMTGALAHDVYGRILRPKSSPEERMRMFKWCAVLIGAVAVLLGSFVEKLEINFMVGQAFAIAAASYFPLLFMSVWWRGMTLKGAAAGMLTGGFLSVIAISLTSVSTLAAGTDSLAQSLSMFKPLIAFFAGHPLLRILCEQPAIWTVPLAITLMVVVSKLTSREVPADIRMKMLVLHAPEKLGLKQEYIQEHQAGPGH